MTATPRITMRRLTSCEEMAPLRAAWNELAGGVPFRGFDWLQSWWRAYGAEPRQELLALAAFDEHEQLIGIAPWYVDRWASPRGVIRYLGSGEVCSDYLTVLCRRGREKELVAALADCLCPENPLPTRDQLSWEVLELGNAYRDDATVNLLLDSLVERGGLVHRRNRSSCWRIRLPKTWDEFLATLSKSHRKQIRRLERNYFDSGRAQLRIVKTPAELARGLQILADLHQRRRESLGERGCFASTRFAVFHEETAQRLLEGGNLRLAWLEVDGHVVAAEYQVLGSGVVYAYQSGIDPDALQHEPGRLITMATLKLAIADGFHAFDFLRGDEAYKAHWRAEPRPTLDLRVIADSRGARLRHNLWRASDNVKVWIKRSLQFSRVKTR